MWPQQNETFLSSSSSRKRKRDPLHVGTPHSINSIRLIPSRSHSVNPSLHLNYSDPLKHGSDYASRLSCITRKRRALPQPGCYPSRPLQSASPLRGQYDTTRNKPIAQPTWSSADTTDSSTAVCPRTLSPRSSQQNSASPSFLRPCHICHRRPTTKELLEAYADCDLCGQRACFVCLRQCDAANCCSQGTHADEGRWKTPLDSFQSGDTDLRALQAIRSRWICSCCAVEGITEAGVEVVQCLACIQ
ncbi:uncharacterized protein BDV17DRAFT_276167 [Aspergillus undulatus]|uniref:uncharacterized protein n=1 Tax=Aspergillus undulatus TaxID=1810928 RepID=UPI003CCD5FA9